MHKASFALTHAVMVVMCGLRFLVAGAIVSYALVKIVPVLVR